MGIVSGHRGGGSRATTAQEGPIVGGTSPTHNKKKWSNLMPLIVALVVFAEIAFLGRLDMAKNAAMVHTWTKSFYYSSLGEEEASNSEEEVVIRGDGDGCEAWLEKQDAVTHSRDFQNEPIWVSAPEEEWDSCAVGCKFGQPGSDKKPDAAFSLTHDPATASVHRSMESSQYYGENNIAQARRRGFAVIMTTSLSSDVPVGYFSWAEYDIMSPLQPKTKNALAAAFISNCGARNFRLQALEMLEKSNIKIDSYGGCHRNHDGRVDKLETLRRYKFSLAFENSNEEDYVTEKFFQSLVAGSVPVVVGAPNILDFAPSPSSVLHIKDLKDAVSVANTMKYLAENPEAYNQSLSWKYEGPSDSFKALVDMAAVHSSCRLCIHLATKIWEFDEKNLGFKRPCKCTKGANTVYHLYVRERGRFKMESVFLRWSNMTLEALEAAVVTKFRSGNHVPIWKQERPEILRGGDELKVHRIYPVGMTQRQALYTFRFNKDADLRTHIQSSPCAKFEVIFV